MKVEGQILDLDIHSATAHILRYIKSRFDFQKAARKTKVCTLRQKSSLFNVLLYCFNYCTILKQSITMSIQSPHLFTLTTNVVQLDHLVAEIEHQFKNRFDSASISM
jgi:hypothetical protein